MSNQEFNRFNKEVDYLCVLDFEATCDRKNQAKPQEIIEFPTLLFDVKTRQVEKEFHYYIRPDVHPKLSDFCTELTGITQERIDNEGISLDQAMDLHKTWLEKECQVVPWHMCTSHEQKTFLYLTCGDWDLNTCLPKQLKYHGRAPAEGFQAWINIKRVFQNKCGEKCRGMTHMLDFFGLELEGRHHSGIDDCRNIARICAEMIEKGWVPKGPTTGGG